MNEKERLFEDDPYWNIDTLTPKKSRARVSPPASPAGRAPAPSVPSARVRTDFSGRQTAGKEKLFIAPYELLEDAEERKNGFPLHPFTPEPARSYEWSGSAVTRVELYDWPNKYAFFAGFRKNALAILDMKGSETPYVEYFSFMPQYHQLTASQVRYYLYWRDSFHAGVCLRTDLCYLLLYISEVLNLPDVLDAQESIDRLCRLWLCYRRAFPKLDKYLSEWVCDYSLCNNVHPDKTLFDALSPIGRQYCVFKEFYLTPEDLRAPGMLASSYSFKASKYRTKENAAVFDTHIPAAMARFFKVFSKTDPRFAPVNEQESARITRMSYDGAVCVFNQKKRIDVYYTPVRTVTPSIFVTDAVKLCENYVHAALNISARFPAPSLSGAMREAIEEYFVGHLPSRSTLTAEREFRYDDRYEPGSRGFSAEEAAKIERSSIDVANALGSVYEEEKSAEAPAAQTDRPSPDAGGASECVCALKALRTGGSEAFSAYASSLGILPHTLAEEINEEALLRIGDIVIVGGEGGFELLPDYEKEVEEWINSN